MSFSDVFKSSFLENVSTISVLDMVMALTLAFCLGVFIFFVYKKTYTGVMYSASFGVTLIAMTMVTAIVILAITSNVVLSLGMVGALSIVRFRAALKEPLEIAFLFWAVAAGIVLAAGFIPLAVFGSLFLGIVLLIFSNRKASYNPYIVVVKCADKAAMNTASEILKANTSRCILKSQTAQKDKIELNYEIRLKGDNTDFVLDLTEKEGIRSAVLVSYNGEYLG